MLRVVKLWEWCHAKSKVARWKCVMEPLGTSSVRHTGKIMRTILFMVQFWQKTRFYPCRAKFIFRKHGNIFSFSIISEHWEGAGNRNPSSWKTRIHSSSIVNAITFDDLAPVPLTVFRSNSKFDQNLECSSLKHIELITTKFCTRHDSYTVVACATFRCDWWSIFQTRVLHILVEFQIWSKYR